jgi:hypothetical protein
MPILMLLTCLPIADDIQALQAVLEATCNALIASHVLHLLHHCMAHSDPPPMTPEQMQCEWTRIA